MIGSIKTGATAVLGGVVGISAMVLLNTLVFFPQERAKGRADERAAVAQAALDATKDRVKDDAKLQSLGAYNLCVEYLGRVPECDSLMQSVREK